MYAFFFSSCKGIDVQVIHLETPLETLMYINTFHWNPCRIIDAQVPCLGSPLEVLVFPT